MKLKSIKFKNYRNFKDMEFKFDSDFFCLIGNNGIGKTNFLNAISAICGSLDFKTIDESRRFAAIQEDARLKAFLDNNIRMGMKEFSISAVIEHDGKEHQVEITEQGVVKNEIRNQPWWRINICYTTKFDSNMRVFQVRVSQWEFFSKAYETITGYKVVPKNSLQEIYGKIVNPLTNEEIEQFYTELYIDKPQDGLIHLTRASAGEQKIAKALAEICNMEESRKPEIILIDNIEMHVHYKRHLIMVEQMQQIFKGKQIIATTHSVPIIQDYQPRSEILDLEEAKLCQPCIVEKGKIIRI